MNEKLYMLELINLERERVGIPAVELGDNSAAQLHAESSLAGCYSSHWGNDGLKPYMRYSLAGSYQSNGENGSGSDYCITAADGYSGLSSIRTEIKDTMAGWMSSPGHRRNILEKKHKKVNIGLAWDKYNIKGVQHFEGDYVEYAALPTFDGSELRLDGKTKNEAQFGLGNTIPVQIFFDPPPQPLTGGQLSRTYCYGSGKPVAYVRKPLTGNSYYPKDTLSTTYTACPNPYEVPRDAPAPRSHNEANLHWQQAYQASQFLGNIPAVMQAFTASTWRIDGEEFQINVSLSRLLAAQGPGVYTVVLWGQVDGDTEIISQYSIFYDLLRPNTYD